MDKSRSDNFSQHIILVSIDTLRADCINASPRAKGYLNQYDAKISLKTDVLDQILTSGLYFNNCISAAPYTAASHGAYFTGMWPLHNGVYEFFNRSLSKPTIFNYAKNKGYATILQTDFPVILGQYLGFTDSVDHYFVENEKQAFKELIKNSNNNTLSFFHFGGVHYPYGFHTLKFGGKDYISKVKLLEKEYGISKKDRYAVDDILDETFRNKKDTELLLRYKYIIEKLYSSGSYNDLFSLYLEGINYFLRHRFNRFILEVKNFVDKNNAVLFIFSDHGEEWDPNSEGHHNSISDNVLRVPLIVYGKRISPRIEDSLIRTIDLAPTVVDLLPQEFEKVKMDGVKLDIFNVKKNIKARKYAISQVWTSIATKKQIANYQSKAMKHKKNIKPLKTYLTIEAIRSTNEKLTNYYKKNGHLLKKEISVIKKTHLGKKKISELKKILVAYNSSRDKKKSKISHIELRIKNELNNLGYKV